MARHSAVTVRAVTVRENFTKIPQIFRGGSVEFRCATGPRAEISVARNVSVLSVAELSRERAEFRRAAPEFARNSGVVQPCRA